MGVRERGCAYNVHTRQGNGACCTSAPGWESVCEGQRERGWGRGWLNGGIVPEVRWVRLVMMGGGKTILVQSGENESDGARENRVEVIIIHDAAKGAEAEGREKRRGEGD